MMSILFLYTIFLTSFVRLPVANAAVSVSNDVNVTVDKDNYKFGQITCHVSGLSEHSSSVHTFNNTINEFKYGQPMEHQVFFEKRSNIKIVSASQLQYLSSINDLNDIASIRSAVFSNISSNKDSVNVTLTLNPEVFFGPKGNNCVGDYAQQRDNGYTKLVMGNTSWIPAGPFRCIVVDNKNGKVLGASQAFTVTGPPDPVTMKVLTPSVLYYETLKADVYNSNYTVFTPIDGDCLRIYKVPYDVSNNLTELNTVGGTAKFVSITSFQHLYEPNYGLNYSAIAGHVSWKEPGKYQIVLLSDYNQVFRGISNVFETRAVARSKNTTVTIAPNSTFSRQNFNVTIYKPDPPYGSQIGIAYIPAGHKVIEYMNGIRRWIFYNYNAGIWNSNTTYLTITTSFNDERFGLHKAVVIAGGIVIGVSKAFEIKRPIIDIRIPLPKRTYSQWESIPIIVDHTNFSYAIIKKSQPDSHYNTVQFSYIKGSREQFGYPIDPNSKRTLVTFAPGVYNIRLFAYNSYVSDRHSGSMKYTYYQLDHVISIPNTTFRVFENTAQLMIANNKTNFNYGETLNFSLTTTNKVPLHGPIRIHGMRPTGFLGLATLHEKGQQESADSSDTLYGSIPIIRTNYEFYFGCPTEPSVYNMTFFTHYMTYSGTSVQTELSPQVSINMTICDPM